MNRTSERILDTALSLMMQIGFHALSFQDIAERIGIRKASIYYHHPGKAELGRDVIARYRERFRTVRDEIDADPSLPHWDGLRRYLEPIMAIASTPDQVCLCGVLGGERAGLPQMMQDELEAFFEENQTWLAGFLDSGKKAGAFHYDCAAMALSRLVFSAVEGGLLIERATPGRNHFATVMDTLTGLLGKPA